MMERILVQAEHVKRESEARSVDEDSCEDDGNCFADEPIGDYDHGGLPDRPIPISKPERTMQKIRNMPDSVVRGPNDDVDTLMKYILEYEAVQQTTAGQFGSATSNFKDQTCEICHQFCTTFQSFKTHVIVYHVRLRHFRCSQCPTSFSRIGALANHMRDIHSVNVPLIKTEIEWLKGKNRRSSTFASELDRKLYFHEDWDITDSRAEYICKNPERSESRNSTPTNTCISAEDPARIRAQELIQTMFANPGTNKAAQHCLICKIAYGAGGPSFMHHVKTVHQEEHRIACQFCWSSFSEHRSRTRHYVRVHPKLRHVWERSTQSPEVDENSLTYHYSLQECRKRARVEDDASATASTTDRSESLPIKRESLEETSSTLDPDILVDGEFDKPVKECAELQEAKTMVQHHKTSVTSPKLTPIVPRKVTLLKPLKITPIVRITQKSPISTASSTLPASTKPAPPTEPDFLERLLKMNTASSCDRTLSRSSEALSDATTADPITTELPSADFISHAMEIVEEEDETISFTLPTKMISCRYCSDEFENRCEYDAHLSEFHADKLHEQVSPLQVNALRCLVCHQTTSNRKKHLEAIHRNSSGHYECRPCGESFERSKDLLIHSSKPLHGKVVELRKNPELATSNDPDIEAILAKIPTIQAVLDRKYEQWRSQNKMFYDVVQCPLCAVDVKFYGLGLHLRLHEMQVDDVEEVVCDMSPFIPLADFSFANDATFWQPTESKKRILPTKRSENKFQKVQKEHKRALLRMTKVPRTLRNTSGSPK